MTNANDLIHSFADSEMHMGNNKGLTKREYFAAMVLQGILARGFNPDLFEKNGSEIAVNWADALINALNR
jgi:hypothetical protein